MSKWIAEFELEDGDTMPKHMNLEYKGMKIDFHCKPLEQKLKVGKWVKYSIPRCGEQHYECTACNDYFNFGVYSDYYLEAFKYCPNCGAKMEESEDKE